MKSKIFSKIILTTLFVLSFSHVATAMHPCVINQPCTEHTLPAVGTCLTLSKNLKHGDGAKNINLQVIRLSQESQIAQVVSLQNFLIESGYMKGSATGYFGGKTLAAVKKYQRANDIRATGFVGEKTRMAMSKNCINADTPRAMCSYAAPPAGCNYINGKNYNSQTGCGMELKCDTVALLRSCPTEKIINKMPVMCIKAPCPAVDNSYYIYNGERKEISDFDSEYVKNNCSVKEIVAY